MNNRADDSADDAKDRTADKQAETAENDNKHFISPLIRLTPSHRNERLST